MGSKKKKREIPRFNNPIIETHCHLDYLKERSIDEVLEKCSELNISQMITISVEPGNFHKAREIAKKYPQVFCSQGVHPHQAIKWNDEVDKELRELAANPKEHKIVALGEMGLDYYYNKSPREKQIEAFKAQMEIAIEFNLPLIIHSRDADEDMIELLEQYGPRLKRKGVVHSFTSGKELAQKALDQGFSLGFNGIITFKNAESVREIVELCPVERILLETDSPFLTPTPYRGGENAPVFLPFIAEKVAEIKALEIETLIEKTTENSTNLFQF